MNQVPFGLALCLAVSMVGCATPDEKPPMPQTRGMQGMDPKLHDEANAPTVTCTPKASAAGMAHAPEDHPMPDTKGMHGMDPALHMHDCHSSDQPEQVQLGPHQHKSPGS